MKNILKALFTIALVLLCSCGKKQPTLHLYSWADYFDPELLRTFEKANNCRVVYDTFDSNEAMLAKLQAGATGYDIIVPSHYMVDALAQSGKLLKLDKQKLVCLSHLDKDILTSMPDSKCEYSVPYTMSYTGIGYNKETVKNFIPSWKMFDRTEYNRRATLLDDKREVIGAALLTLNLDPNSTNQDDLLKAKALIKGWSKNICKFENEQYKNGLASGEFHMVMGYSGDLMQIINENPNLAFAIPEEGAMMSCDMLVIPATSQNQELAYAFINFIHDPDNAVQNMKFTFYLSPNKDAYPLLPDAIKNNPAMFIDKNILQRSRFTVDQKEKESHYNKLWDDIKAGN